MKTITLTVVLAAAFATMLATPGRALAIDPSDLGPYEGQWNNTTFGSSGDVSLVFSSDGSNVTADIDLDGFVFGFSDPPPFQFIAPIGGDGSVSFDKSGDPFFGDMDVDVTDAGVVTMDFRNFPSGSPAQISGFDHIAVTGTIAGGVVDLDYQIFNAPSNLFAQGTLDATLIPEPASALLVLAGGFGLLRRRR